MLGVNSPRELVSGNFAKEIREALRRAMTGQLTESEKEARRGLKATDKEWSIEWRNCNI